MPSTVRLPMIVEVVDDSYDLTVDNVIRVNGTLFTDNNTLLIN